MDDIDAWELGQTIQHCGHLGMYPFIYSFTCNTLDIILTLFKFVYSYQENKLRLQRSLALAILPRGNIRMKRALNTVIVDEQPLRKIRRIKVCFILSCNLLFFVKL